MGAWGPGIFSDDPASDLRDDFRDLVANGVDAVEATTRLVAEYRPDHDPDDGPVFWIALAAVQWQLGRLDEEVKQRALDVIHSEADLHKWRSADARTIRRRQAALDDLRARLLLPPPPPRRLRPRYVAETEFEVGDIVSYLLLSGRHVLLRVVAIHVDKGGRVPVVDVIVGESEADGAAGARGKHLLTSGNGSHASRFMIGQMSEREYPAKRLTIVRRKSRGWGPSSWPSRAALLPWQSRGSTADAHGGIG